jgi:hypothetical protein
MKFHRHICLFAIAEFQGQWNCYNDSIQKGIFAFTVLMIN